MFYKFKKGSPEAKAHMAKLRAMVGKKRKKNPMTRKEAADVLNYAKSSVDRVRKMRDRGVRAFQAGRASGMSSAVAMVGPKEAERSARKLQARAFDESLYPYKTPYVPKRKRNPPLLILGNPGSRKKLPIPQGLAMPNDRCLECGSKRATHFLGGPCFSVRFERAGSWKARQTNPGRRSSGRRHSSAELCPKGFPAHIWRDPAFQRELKVFRSRHGANVPVHISKVQMPAGSPRFMTAYGRAQHAVYDAPKQRKGGNRFKHSFGKKGKNKPFLVSSVSKGPRWLGYAGGTFKARSKWLYD